jgi:long-subunit fatty acid transport protein
MLGMAVLSTTIYAGSIDYLSNQSAEYLMTFCRTAATDSADIAYYNPAGTVFMPKNGFYINSSLQCLAKPYKQTFMGETYKQNDPSYIPNSFFVYKKDALAAYFNINVTAGGGRVMWKDGNATTDFLAVATGKGAAEGVAELMGASYAGTGATSINSMKIGASSVYKGLNPGFAYKINDNASFSLGGRYIIADRYAHAKADFQSDVFSAAPGYDTHVSADSDFDYTAQGFGGIIGFDLKPVNNLMLALRYETHTNLDFNYNIRARSVSVDSPNANVQNSIYNSISGELQGLDHDGGKSRYDLPAMFSLGANYTVTPELDVMTSLNYYFFKDAVMSGVSSGQYDNGWEFGVGTTYKVKPELKLGAGILYTKQPETDKTPYNNINPGLNSWTVGLGETYSINGNLDTTLTGSWTQYIKDKDPNFAGSGFEVEYKKTVYNIAAGFQYRFNQ